MGELIHDYNRLKELPSQIELEVTERALLTARDEKRVEDMTGLKDKIVDMRRSSGSSMRAREMMAELVILKSKLDNRYLELVNEEDDEGCAVIQEYIEKVAELNKLERPRNEKQMRLKVKVPKPVPEVIVIAKAAAVGVRVNSHIDSGDEKEDRAFGVKQRIEKFNGMKQQKANETTLDMLKQKADRNSFEKKDMLKQRADRLSEEKAAENADKSMADKFNNNRFKSTSATATVPAPTPIVTTVTATRTVTATTPPLAPTTAASSAPSRTHTQAPVQSYVPVPVRTPPQSQSQSQTTTRTRTQSYTRTEESFASSHSSEEVKEDPSQSHYHAVDKAEEKDKIVMTSVGMGAGDVMITMAEDKSNEMKDMGVKQRIEKFNAMKASAAAATARMSEMKSTVSTSAGSKSPNITSDGSKLLEVRSRFDKFSDPKSPSGHFIVEKLSGEKLHLVKEEENF